MVTSFRYLIITTFFILGACGKNDGVSLLSDGQPKNVFITASQYNANLGGVAGADAKCASDSRNPGSGIYKAFIVNTTTRIACTTNNCSGGSSEHVDWVLQPNTEYRRLTDGVTVGFTNDDALFTFNLLNPVDATYNYWVWTGLTSTWTTYNNNCGQWTNPTSGLAGIGLGDKIDLSAVYYGNGSCPTNGRILCIEQ